MHVCVYTKTDNKDFACVIVKPQSWAAQKIEDLGRDGAPVLGPRAIWSLMNVVV